MEAPDSEVFLEKQSCYRGRAKVDLSAITFQASHLPGGRCLDMRNVERLVDIFSVEGCHRVDLEHSVPAVIENTVFARALERSRLEQSHLLDARGLPPLLQFHEGEHVVVLHGQHRIEAARRFFPHDDRWWVIDIYSSTLGEEAMLSLREEHQNAREFSDGDIFRHMRHYQSMHNETQVSKWQARLSKSKLRDVKILASRFPLIMERLDALLPYTGLWASLQLGTLHRLLSLNCEEELLTYLDHIFRVWVGILQTDANACLLDVQTVAELQLLSPARSLQDRSTITAKMISGRFFPNITNEDTRSRIMDRILCIDGRIPSLYTFLEDTKYLQPCAISMKFLLPPKSKRSTAQEFRACYSALATSNQQPESQRCLESAYRQLWLYCMSHFPRLQHIGPRKDPGMPKPSYTIAQHMLVKLATFAYDLGFRSAYISSLMEHDPLDSVVRAFIQTTRPCDKFEYDLSTLNAGVRNICDFLRSMTERSALRRTPSMVSDSPLPLQYRCGRPFESSFLADESSLHIHNIYRRDPEEIGQGLSHFGIKSDIFCCFFGYNNPTTVDANLNNEPAEALTRPLIASSLYSPNTTMTMEPESSDFVPSARSYSPASMNSLANRGTSDRRSHTRSPEPGALANDILRFLEPQSISESSFRDSSIGFFELEEEQLYKVTSPQCPDVVNGVIQHYQNSGNCILTVDGTSFSAHPLCTDDTQVVQCPLYIVATKGAAHPAVTPKVSLLITSVFPVDIAPIILNNWPFG